MNLIPAEHWEYGISDLIHGFAAAGRVEKHSEMFLPGLGNCLTIGSGRAGLVMALRALNFTSGARIGVPLYCCPVVLKAIELADCRPQFIDIDAETFCISEQDLANKIDQVDAIIAVHMFGNMCDMRALRSIVRDKPIIEDCAQALGSRMNDRLAGSFGDIAFFSFRSGKYLSAGEGGAIFSGRSDLYGRLQRLINSLQDVSCRDEIIHILKTYIRSTLRSKPLYGWVGYPLWAFYNKKTGHTEKASVSINNIYKSDSAIATTRLKSIDASIARQRDNANFYEQYLELEPGMTCKEKPGSFYNRYLYPIIFASPAQRDIISKYLHKQGIGTIKPYSDIAQIATTHYGYKGDCPVSEEIAARVLAIPNHYNLQKKERQHIVQSLNKGWQAFRDR